MFYSKFFFIVCVFSINLYFSCITLKFGVNMTLGHSKKLLEPHLVKQ